MFMLDIFCLCWDFRFSKGPRGDERVESGWFCLPQANFFVGFPEIGMVM